MCSICNDVLTGLRIVHEEQRCPLRLSRYCYLCARYGHKHTSCPVTQERVLHIQNTDQAIKEFLLSHNIKCGKNNKRLLTEYADMNQMRIVYSIPYRFY